jgi:hypothetical protein
LGGPQAHGDTTEVVPWYKTQDFFRSFVKSPAIVATRRINFIHARNRQLA